MQDLQVFARAYIETATTCGCAERLEVLIARDAFNMLTLILLVVGVVVLIVGIAGAVLAKDAE